MTIITREAVIQIIADESGLEADKLSGDTRLEDLDISSIDLVSAIFTIEEKLNITISPEDVPKNATISELVDLVMSHSGE